jgi:hypothetical protein
VASNIFGLQNSVKAIDGRYKGLLDKNVMDAKRKDEEDFKAKVMANPEWKTGLRRRVGCHRRSLPKGGLAGQRAVLRSTDSQLGGTAATIVDYVAEIKKPDGERLEWVITRRNWNR